MIRIQNIYYMLAYAFQVLNEQGYKNIATEEFDNTAELCAAILARGISTQVKRGLGKEYIPQTEALSSLRGKLDISESIKTQTFLKKQMICSYDDFSVNSVMNRIIKSTVLILLKGDISKSRKKELRKLMVFFEDVDVAVGKQCARLAEHHVDALQLHEGRFFLVDLLQIILHSPPPGRNNIFPCCRPQIPAWAALPSGRRRGTWGSAGQRCSPWEDQEDRAGCPRWASSRKYRR